MKHIKWTLNFSKIDQYGTSAFRPKPDIGLNWD
jgi:hypothetical protein